MARIPDGTAVRHTQTGWTGRVVRHAPGADGGAYRVTWDRSGSTGSHAPRHIEPLPDSYYVVLPMPERFTKGDDPEPTIRRCLWLYPTLFQSRTDVLVHLWLHYGNGFEWDEETGDLYSIGDDRDDRPSEEVYPESASLSALGIDDGTAKLRAERDAEYAAVRRDIERAATTLGPVRDRMHTGTYSRKYSYLWNLPAGASAAWRMAHEEAVRVLQPLVDEVEGEVERLAPHRAALVKERRELQARLAEIDRELREMP